MWLSQDTNFFSGPTLNMFGRGPAPASNKFVQGWRGGLGPGPAHARAINTLATALTKNIGANNGTKFLNRLTKAASSLGNNVSPPAGAPAPSPASIKEKIVKLNQALSGFIKGITAANTEATMRNAITNINSINRIQVNNLNNTNKNALANAKLKRNVALNVITSTAKNEATLNGVKALVDIVDSLTKVANNVRKSTLANGTTAVNNGIKRKNYYARWYATKNALRKNTSTTGSLGVNPGGAAPVVLGGGGSA
jgi:hypothetical protein